VTVRAGFLAACLLAAGPSAAADAAPGADDCLACHASADAGGPVVDGKAFAASRHARSACTGCHARGGPQSRA